MESIDPRQLGKTDRIITFVEDEKGTFHPHLNGIPIPGVVEVEMNWTAQSVRTATIKVRLFDRQFDVAVRGAFQSVTAEAIQILRELQWESETAVETGGTEYACPWCDAPKRIGVHTTTCRLAAAIGAPRGKPPAPEDWDARGS